MLIRITVLVWVLPIGVQTLSAAIFGVRRNFKGDVFVLRREIFENQSGNSSEWDEVDKGDPGRGCSVADCRSGGRHATLIPWRRCQCQCDHSSPTFRQDRGDCVNTIDECRLVPFTGSASSENIPLVFLPPSGHLIYPSADIALAASMSSFPHMSCHVRRARHLTASGWTDVSNVTRQKLAFQLVHDSGRFFLQYVGTETSRRLLEGHVLLVEFACKAANDANIVPDPCASFRVAGTLAAESFSAAPWTLRTSKRASGSSGSSKKPKDMYMVIGLCAGLLGVMYVLAVLIYLLVRRQQREKRKRTPGSAADAKFAGNQGGQEGRRDNELTTRHPNDGRQGPSDSNRGNSSNEFFSKLRSVIEAARSKLGPNSYLPSLKDIPEETASICDSLDGLEPKTTSNHREGTSKENLTLEIKDSPSKRWRHQEAISGNWSALCANPGFMLNRELPETTVRRSSSSTSEDPNQEQTLLKTRSRSLSSPEFLRDKAAPPPPPPLPSFGSSKMPIDSLVKVRKIKPAVEESPYYSLAETNEGPETVKEEPLEEQSPPPLPPKILRCQGIPLPAMVHQSAPIKRMNALVDGDAKDTRKVTVHRGHPVDKGQKELVIERSDSSVSDTGTESRYPEGAGNKASGIRRSGSSASDTANRRKNPGFEPSRHIHKLHSGSLSSVLPRRQQVPQGLTDSRGKLPFSEDTPERRILVKALVESYNKRQLPGGKGLKRSSGRLTALSRKGDSVSSFSDFGDDSTLERDAGPEDRRVVGTKRKIRRGTHEDPGYHSSDSELSSAMRFIQRSAVHGQHGSLMAASRVRFSVPEVVLAVDDNEFDLKGDVASNVSDGSFPDSLNGSPTVTRNPPKRFPEAYEFVFTEKV